MSIALSSFAGVGSQFFDDNGNVLSGGLVYTYAAGTLNPLATYNDAEGTIPHSNPIVLDSGGRIPSGGVMWVTAELDYDFVVRSSIGQLIATYQDINNFQGLVDTLRTDLAATTGSDLIGYGDRTVESRLADSVSVFDYIPQAEHAAIQAGTSTYDCTDDIALAIAENGFLTGGPGAYGKEKVIIWPQGIYCVKHIDVTATRDVWFWSLGYVQIKGVDSTLKKFVFGSTNYNVASPELSTVTTNFYMGGPGQWEFYAADGTAYEAGINLEHFTISTFEKVASGSGYVAVTDATKVTVGNVVGCYMQYSYSNRFIRCGFSCPAAPPVGYKSYGLAMGNNNINLNVFTRCNFQGSNITAAPYVDTVGVLLSGNTNIFDSCDTSALDKAYVAIGRGHQIINPYAEYITRFFSGGTGTTNDGCIVTGGIIEIVNDGFAYYLNNTQNLTIIGGYYKSAFAGTRYFAEVSGCYGLNVISPLFAAGAFTAMYSGTYRNPGALCNTVLQPKWITFPTTPQLSTDAKTLDDYQEGTFNATMTFGGTSVGVTYAYNSCTYTKIGNRVMVSGSIALSSKGSSVGNAIINGLPFAISSGTDSYSAVSLFMQNITFADVYQGWGTVGGTTIDLYEVTNAGANTRLTDADFANNSFIVFSLTYKTSL